VKYIVDISGTRVEIEIDGDQVRVDGGPAQTARVDVVDGTPVQLVKIGSAVHRVTARRDGARGRYVLRIAASRLTHSTNVRGRFVICQPQRSGHPDRWRSLRRCRE
jgi:hypothetical protein